MDPESIAHYRITGKLGEGGMGAVYRATDTKLGRDVAIKVLPEMFAQDADRLARFTREAEILASLNHPNIATIFGIEEHAIVMELIEGPTLADRIERGAVPLDEALGIARQIAAALEAAHEKNVVHRDLKPANVKVTPEGTVKVLDFGLAKLSDPREPAENPQSAPTVVRGHSPTIAGMIMGTAEYMSPEQASGKPVDKRTDIWAFGVVLHELITGNRLFQGESISHIVAAVLTQNPDLSRIPPKAKKIIQRCLEKDPKKRLRDIGDAFLLEEETEPVLPAAPVKRENQRHVPVLAAVLALSVATTGYLALHQFKHESPQVITATILPTGGVEIVNRESPAISPDGSKVVFIGISGGKRALWLRELASANPRLLPGTDGGEKPFWSPDNKFVGFASDGQLKKVSVAGGPAQTICPIDAVRLGGGTWGRRDVIVFSTGQEKLYQVPASGGTPAPAAIAPKTAEQDKREPLLFPWFLPDGRHFLYTSFLGAEAESSIYAGDIAAPETRKLLLPSATNAGFAEPGYLVYPQDGTLLAQRFDAASLALSGEPRAITAPGVLGIPIGGFFTRKSTFDISQSGALVYVGGAHETQNQITWLDRKGKAIGTVGPPGYLQAAALSPDDSRVVTSRRFSQPGHGFRDVWVYDVNRGSATRLTFEGHHEAPVWSPDGKELAYRHPIGGKSRIVRKLASGASTEVEIPNVRGRVLDWSRDGRYLFTDATSTSAQNLCDLIVNPLDGKAKPLPYVQATTCEFSAKLSPDGRWLAYDLGPSSLSEVYVVSFPTPGGKWQISAGGGSHPVWSRDGRELYFVGAGSKLMAVPVKSSLATFEFGSPSPLFDIRFEGLLFRYDVSKDGRFLAPVPVAGDSARTTITLVQNWPALLAK